MAKTKITLSIEPRIYEKYRKHCENKGLIMSKQVELFMEEELKKGESNE